MTNSIVVGDRLTIPAPVDIASGEGVLLETLFGVAEGAAISGSEVVLKLSGVFGLPKAPSQERAIGADTRPIEDNACRTGASTHAHFLN